jgi:hypothetical protein
MSPTFKSAKTVLNQPKSVHFFTGVELQILSSFHRLYSATASLTVPRRTINASGANEAIGLFVEIVGID